MCDSSTGFFNLLFFLFFQSKLGVKKDFKENLRLYCTYSEMFKMQYSKLRADVIIFSNFMKHKKFFFIIEQK